MTPPFDGTPVKKTVSCISANTVAVNSVQKNETYQVLNPTSRGKMTNIKEGKERRGEEGEEKSAMGQAQPGQHVVGKLSQSIPCTRVGTTWGRDPPELQLISSTHAGLECSVASVYRISKGALRLEKSSLTGPDVFHFAAQIQA